MSTFFGHFHVVLVHLPIGILLLACVFQWLATRPGFSSLRQATGIAFLIGMISAVLSAITGYLLSLSGDYDEHLVSTHQWFGISVACVSIVMYYFYRTSSSPKTQTAGSAILVGLIIITGHLGGSLTHGSDYLTKGAWNSSDTATVQRKPIANVQDAVVYTDIIQPLLQTKCYSCHGKNKQKGKLRMDDTARLMKGGKDGVVIIPGNDKKSEMSHRISLPREDDDHMPPKEKPQLNEQEIALIHWWIASGASFSRKVKETAQPEEIRPALVALQSEQRKRMIEPDIPAAPVAKADDGAIKKLKDRDVIIEQVAQGTNYLSANFVTAPAFNDSEMQLLLPLKEQLVELKLGNTLLTDSSLLVLSQLHNLLRLQLDHTRVTDKGLGNLGTLQNLRYINLVGTRVTAEGVMKLKSLKNLRSIYLYQAAVNRSDWSNLKRAFPKTLIDSGGYNVPLFPTDTMEVKPPKTVKQ